MKKSIVVFSEPNDSMKRETRELTSWQLWVRDFYAMQPAGFAKPSMGECAMAYWAAKLAEIDDEVADCSVDVGTDGVDYDDPESLLIAAEEGRSAEWQERCEGPDREAEIVLIAPTRRSVAKTPSYHVVVPFYRVAAGRAAARAAAPRSRTSRLNGFTAAA